MLNQEWWTHLAIFNISHRKRVRTLESFFTPNRSQSESEKNDTEEEECINQEETDEDQRKPKKSPTFFPQNLFAGSPMVVLWKGRVRLPEIKNGIKVYKGMPGRDSAVKRFEV